jgi:hydrogenase nickel incorporation protein HypB
VLVGDLETERDAIRIRQAGIPSMQIVTNGVCHLEAQMVLQAFDHFDTDGLDLLFVENVGNLVCPAAFDLGEDYRVTLLASTEGDDKPKKYPRIFPITPWCRTRPRILKISASSQRHHRAHQP